MKQEIISDNPLMSEISGFKINTPDKEKILKEFIKQNRDENVNISIIREEGTANYERFFEGVEPFHVNYKYMAYPPNVYFSANIKFIKSVINHYQDTKYRQYLKLQKMDLEDFLIYLDEIYKKNSSEEHTKREMMKEYLGMYIKEFPKRKGVSLFIVGPKNMCIYKGMYLFGLLPEFFVRVF